MFYTLVSRLGIRDCKISGSQDPGFWDYGFLILIKDNKDLKFHETVRHWLVNFSFSENVSYQVHTGKVYED